MDLGLHSKLLLSLLFSGVKVGFPLFAIPSIPYRIETFEWDGIVEPIFLDDQIDNITLSQGKIMADVPCLEFQ